MEARNLADAWFRGDQEAKQEIDQLLNGAGPSFDVVLAEGLAARLNEIERFDRLIANAEARRNAVLREFSRHRDAVAAKLARAGQAIEEAEFAEIDPTDDHNAGSGGQQP